MHHRCGTTGKQCTERADPDGHHAVLCKIGGAPYAAHSSGCHVLHQAMTQGAYQSKREQVIPELATEKCKSPQLDIEGFGLLGQSRLLVDFTIRHPLAARYESSGTQIAEAEKQAHYPPKGGLRVHSATMETYGRHGDDLAQLLELLADSARQRELSQGGKPTRWLKKWRVQLSHVAAVYVGRAIQQASSTESST